MSDVSSLFLVSFKWPGDVFVVSEQQKVAKEEEEGEKDEMLCV